METAPVNTTPVSDKEQLADLQGVMAGFGLVLQSVARHLDDNAIDAVRTEIAIALAGCNSAITPLKVIEQDATRRVLEANHRNLVRGPRLG